MSLPSSIEWVEVTGAYADLKLDRLCHNVWGPHDENFHRLWNELRDEWEVLQLKGFSGEGFLGKGQALGGSRMPPDEVRRLARVAAQERAKLYKKDSGRRLGGSGGSSTGTAPRGRVRLRDILAGAAQSRNKAQTTKVDSGCATGTAVGTKAAQDALSNGFRTKAEMDDANSIAIAQALQELYEQEEDNRIYDGLSGPAPTEGLTWDPTTGLQPVSAPTSRSTTPTNLGQQFPPRGGSRAANGFGSGQQEYNMHGNPVSRLVREAEAKHSTARSRSQVPQSPTPAFQNWPTSDTGASLFGGSSTSRPISVSSTEDDAGADANWGCLQCTFHNHAMMEKCEICDAPRARHPATTTTTRRRAVQAQKPLPPDPPLGWVCMVCGTYMERNWWTCSQCGTMKASS